MIKCLTKRITVLLLCFATVFSVASFSEKTYADDTVTRAEWLTSLVDTFEMTIEEDEVYPDNYFSDLDASSDYYKKLLIATEFGLIDVEAGEPINPDDPATRDFAVSTLNYCLGFQLEEGADYSFNDKDEISDPDSAEIAVEREWLSLINGNFSPQTPITTAERDKMLADAEEVWNSTEVDDSHEDTYKIKAGVSEVPENTEAVLIDEETLQIIGCPIEINNNDLFVVHLNGIPVGYKAESVEKNDKELTIKVSEPERDEIFDELDIEGTLDGGALVFPEADENGNVEIYYEEEEPTRKISGTVKTKASMKYNGKIDLGDGVSVKVSAEMENIKVKYKVNLLGESFVKLTGSSKVSASCGVDFAEAGGFNEIPLTPATIPGVGGFDVVVEVGLSGKCSLQTKGYMETGAAVSLKGFRIIRSFKAKQFSVVCEVSAEISLKARLGITGSEMPFEGFVYIKGGGKAHVVDAVYPSGKPARCKTYSAWVAASYGAKIKVKYGTSAFSESNNFYHDIYNEKNSPIRIYHHYEDGREVGKCSRPGDFAQYGKLLKYYTSPDSPFWSSGYMGAAGYYDEGTFVPVFTFEKFKNEKMETEARITGYTGNAFCLNIPETVSDDDGEYKVTKIGANAFKNRQDLYSLTIPDTVDIIEYSAFDRCSNLNMAIIPDSVTEIDQFAFVRCVSLSSLTLPENIKIIKGGAFGHCDSLTSVKIPKSIEETTSERDETGYYHYGIFYGCSRLRKITFENGITSIPCGILANMPALVNITIPDTVTIIQHHAFEWCQNLQKVNLSNSLQLIEEFAFYKCTSLDNLIIPDSVTEIKNSAFGFDTSMKNLVLSKGLLKIEGLAFGRCDSLTSVEIPKSITETTTGYNNDIIYDHHYGVFAKCENLSNVTFEKGITTIPKGILANTDGLKEISIPDTVTKIDAYAFEDCKYLNKINFSNNLLLICSHSFNGCSSIQSLEIPDSVTDIREYAFARNASLEELKLSNHLESISGGAFAYCDSLGTVTIPKSLKKVVVSYEIYGDSSAGIFRGGLGPKKVIFEDGTKTIYDGMLCRNNGIEEIVIFNSVTTIEQYAFHDCDKLETAILPNSVTEIGNNVFLNCVSLKNTTLPENISKISDSHFNNCPSLEEITIPDKVVKIGTSAFRGTGIKTITVPSSVNEIGDSALRNCISLTSVNIKSKNLKIGNHTFRDDALLSSINLPEGLTSIGTYAFSNCDALTDVDLPSSVTEVGTHAYDDCASLRSFEFNNKITSIKESLLDNCGELSEVRLPLVLESIGVKAFENDVKLKEIYIPRSVTTIDPTAFSYYSQLTIYGVKGTYAESFASEHGATFKGKDTPATSITLDETITIPANESRYLNLSIAPADSTDEIVWVSANESIATVDSTGKVSAKAPGEVNIKVYIGEDLSKTCKVTVIQYMTRIYINPSSLTMNALETHKLSLTYNPANATNPSIKVFSLHPEVADIDSDTFVVTAKKKGETTIRVEALDGSGISSECKVTVTNTAVIAEDVAQLESEHNYANNCTDIWLYKLENAKDIAVTFNEQTEFEEGFDYLYIYSGNGTQIGRYTGTELASKTVIVAGDTVKLQLSTNTRGTAWGFKVDAVEATENPIDPETCDHKFGDYEYYDKNQHVRTCEYCETKKYEEHDWEEDEYEIVPTLTKNGKMKYYCWQCDSYKTEIVDPVTEGECGDEVYYSFDPDSGVLTISGEGHMYNYEEDESPFAGQTAIKKIVVEEDVYSISENAFSGAANVESIALPSSIESIGTGAFTDCTPKVITYAGSEEDFSNIELPDDVAEVIESAEMKWDQPTVDKKDISNLNITLEYTSIVYSRWQRKPKVYVDNLDEGFDYSVTYTDNLNVGTATVTVKGIGDYKGTKKLTFRITPKEISDADLELPKTSYVYSGSFIEPEPESYYLSEDRDYVLSYENNEVVGTATVIIEGKGNYKGTLSLNFNIVPKGTKLSKLVPSKKAMTVRWKKQAVQTSGYEIQYGLKSSFKGAKKATISKASATSKKLKKLKSKKKYYVRIRTFKKVGTEKYYSSWSAKKAVKVE